MKGIELTEKVEKEDEKNEKKKWYSWIHMGTGKHGWAYGDPDNPSPDDKVTGDPPEWPMSK